MQIYVVSCHHKIPLLTHLIFFSSTSSLSYHHLRRRVSPTTPKNWGGKWKNEFVRHNEMRWSKFPWANRNRFYQPIFEFSYYSILPLPLLPPCMMSTYELKMLEIYSKFARIHMENDIGYLVQIRINNKQWNHFSSGRLNVSEILRLFRMWIGFHFSGTEYTRVRLWWGKKIVTKVAFPAKQFLLNHHNPQTANWTRKFIFQWFYKTHRRFERITSWNW